MSGPVDDTSNSGLGESGPISFCSLCDDKAFRKSFQENTKETQFATLIQRHGDRFKNSLEIKSVESDGWVMVYGGILS